MAAAGKVTQGQVEMGEVPSVKGSHRVEEASLAMETVHGGDEEEGGADAVGEPLVAMGDPGRTQTTDSHLSKCVWVRVHVCDLTGWEEGM